MSHVAKAVAVATAVEIEIAVAVAIYLKTINGHYKLALNLQVS